MEMVGQPYRRRASHGHLIDCCSGEDEQKRGGSEHGNSFASRTVLYAHICKCVCVQCYITSGDIYDLRRRLDQPLTCRRCCSDFCGHAFPQSVVDVSR